MERCPWNPAGLLPPAAVLVLAVTDTALERRLNHPISCMWLKSNRLACFTGTERTDAVGWGSLFPVTGKAVQRHLEEDALWPFHVSRTRFHHLKKILKYHPGSFTTQWNTAHMNNPSVSNHLYLSEITKKSN